MARRSKAGDEDVLARMERACGIEAVEKLCAAVGGTEVYLGPAPRPGNPVFDTIGAQAAHNLWAEIGSGRLLIPRGRFRRLAFLRRQARELEDQGVSRSRIARLLGIHTRTVYRWLERDA